MDVFNGYRISSPYGWRTDPMRGGREFHPGIDLVKADRAPIQAFTEGTVLFAGMGQTGTGLGGYGNVVVVRDKNNRAQLYAHLSSIAVKKGMTIKKGQVIGYQGATGNVTGSHLHFEVRKRTSPNYGWEAEKERSTLAPAPYLESYYPKVQPTANSGIQTYKVNKPVNGFVTADDARRHVNKKQIVNAGTYYVFKVSGQMLNVTSKKGVPGSWINPADNVAGVVVPTSKQPKKLVLPKSASSWRVYPINKVPIKGNEIGFLNPQKFGGLEYNIIGSPQKDVYTIKTANFGTVNIYAAPSTGALIK